MQIATVLVVEDSPDDVLFIRRAFERVGTLHRLVVVSKGEEAIQYLRGQGRFARRERFPLPQLILLDLKLPGVDGFDLLEWLRHQPALRQIPTVVLTGSDYPPDLERAYGLGAKSFVLKPCSLEQLTLLIRQISQSWLVLPALQKHKTEATAPPARCGQFSQPKTI